MASDAERSVETGTVHVSRWSRSLCTPPFLEAVLTRMRRRPLLVPFRQLDEVSQVPLAKEPRLVACFLQNFGNGDFRVWQRHPLGDLKVVVVIACVCSPDAISIVIPSRENSPTSWRADGTVAVIPATVSALTTSHREDRCSLTTRVPSSFLYLSILYTLIEQ